MSDALENDFSFSHRLIDHQRSLTDCTYTRMFYILICENDRQSLIHTYSRLSVATIVFSNTIIIIIAPRLIDNQPLLPYFRISVAD